MKTIAFFNNKGGVGKTTLVYHLAWMFAELGHKILVADLDPQSNLTSMFLDDQRLEEIWDINSNERSTTIYSAIKPRIEGTGDVNEVHLEELSPNLRLIPGDLKLASFEDYLSEAWSGCLGDRPDHFRTTVAFYRIFEKAVKVFPVDLILIDVGPNFGAINRAAMIATQHIVIPLAADLFSMQGLKNLGPTLNKWRKDWQKRKPELTDPSISLPEGEMKPLGYILMQYNIRSSRPVKAYQRWMEYIPQVYRESGLDENEKATPAKVEDDPYCLSTLKHYRSLMPMTMEARKPIFHLTPADGAIGAHLSAVHDCQKDFQELAEKILSRLVQ